MPVHQLSSCKIPFREGFRVGSRVGVGARVGVRAASSAEGFERASLSKHMAEGFVRASAAATRIPTRISAAASSIRFSASDAYKLQSRKLQLLRAAECELMPMCARACARWTARGRRTRHALRRRAV
jgi:hypothetical protein